MFRYISPLDIAWIVFWAACIYDVVFRRKGAVRGWALLFIFLIVWDAVSYLRVIPTGSSVLWSVPDFWKSLNFKSSADLSLFVKLVSGTAALAFLGCLTWMAAGRHFVRVCLCSLCLLWVVGFRPAASTREHTPEDTRSVAAALREEAQMDSRIIGAIRQATASQPCKVLDVVANKRDNRNFIRVRQGSGLMVVHQPDLELDFFLRNMRSSTGAQADPQHYIRGTFREPCMFRAGDLPQTPEGTWPINPRIRPLPASTTVIAVDGFEFHPVLSDTTFFIARKSGNINMSFNLPRHAGGYIRGNADGRRTFKIWAVTAEDIRAFQATAQSAP